MPVVVVLLAALIIGGVVVVATGRGGELARDRGDVRLQTDFRTWSDVAGYRPPPALLGYDAATTERALSLIARTIAERDAEIAWLRSRLAEVRQGPSAAEPLAGEGELDAQRQLGGSSGWQTGPSTGGASAVEAGFTAGQAAARAGDDA